MAGDNRMVTENFLRLNFAARAKGGITPGTDDLIGMDYIHIRTRYNVEIIRADSDSRIASQNEVIFIGGAYQGGVVAYIYQSGDTGYVSGQTHGIIAAAADEATTWSWFTSNVLTNATASYAGAGAVNTPLIVSVCGTVYTYAARTCSDKSLNGYTDWQLPCYWDLSAMYNNRVAIGGFAAGSYWSSTEASTNNAYTINFAVGVTAISSAKTSLTNVRAVRYF